MVGGDGPKRELLETTVMMPPQVAPKKKKKDCMETRRSLQSACWPRRTLGWLQVTMPSHHRQSNSPPPLSFLEVARHGLEGRVEFLGALEHRRVRSVLARGHLFLNCSLTESFCITIVEAACAGLFVVATKVGGVAEVLPTGPEEVGSEEGGQALPVQFTAFVEPTRVALSGAVSANLPQALRLDPFEVHRRVRDMYSWPDVARRTEAVYDAALEGKPPPPLTGSGGTPRSGPRSGGGFSKLWAEPAAPASQRAGKRRPTPPSLEWPHPDSAAARAPCTPAPLPPLSLRLARYRACGPVSGLLACAVALLLALAAALLDLVDPPQAVEHALDWSQPPPPGLMGVCEEGNGTAGNEEGSQGRSAAGSLAGGGCELRGELSEGSHKAKPRLPQGS